MLASLLLCSGLLLQLASAKLTQISQRVLVMDEHDKIVGSTVHTFYRDDEVTASPPPLPEPPMNTSPELQQALRASFPLGSPNVTVSDPWTKKAETCGWATDSHLVHHFEDTAFVPTNDVCALGPGMYTWIVTADHQLSMGQFLNTYEFGSKHANLALQRTGYVAGEFAVVPATQHSKAMITWNLMSGTYSVPISTDQNPDDPMAYLRDVFYPKMNAAFSTLPCAKMLKYGGESEFFPDALPSGEEVSSMCAQNYFVKYENALTWSKSGKNVCTGWDATSSCS